MMSRSAERAAAAAAGAFLAATALLALPARADEPPAPVLDITAVVLDLTTTVESLDGAEAEESAPDKRTVILTSDVLFAQDSYALTTRARQRLRQIARDIKVSRAAGTVRVDGHTDDQGSAAYGVVLSRRRADAVRDVLAPLLKGADLTIATAGHGEARPRVPNIVDGKAIPANRAKNRRVEISFAPDRRPPG